MLRLILAFLVFLALSHSHIHNPPPPNSNNNLNLFRTKRDYDYSPNYAKWTALANRRAAILEALEAVDQAFNSAVQEALVLSDSARRSITKETRLSYIRAWTYGLTTIGASFFAIKSLAESSEDGFPLSYSEELGVYSNLAFGYGYGAPYLIEGQLGSADPGCGGKELAEALTAFHMEDYFGNRYGALTVADGTVNPSNLVLDEHHPGRVRLDLIEHIRGGRRSNQCILGNDAGVALEGRLTRIETLGNQRLDLTEKLISNLERESELAKEFGYGTDSDQGYQDQYQQHQQISSHETHDHQNLQRISTPDTALYYSPL